MKRARRLKLTHRIDGRCRRRIAKMLRVAFEHGDGSKFYRVAWEKRDGRRLAEAGLVSVAVTKSWWGIGAAKEITLFQNHAEAVRRYPHSVPPRGHAWTSKRPKRGAARRASKRRWRATVRSLRA